MSQKKHEILCELKRLAVELGHTPSRDEFREKGRISESVVRQIFGGWTPAIHASGLDPVRPAPLEAQTRPPKILLWDIEASNLNANYGFIFCIGYKWLGESKVHLISSRDFPEQFEADPSDDSLVVAAFSEVLNEADAQVTWYGARFDYPFVQTRLLEHNLPPLPRIPHIDGWRIAKYQLKFNSNRLDTVSRFLAQLDGKNAEFKTQIDPKCWIRAQCGHVNSIRYIEDHCIADVKVLENVYQKIKPFASQLPNMSKLLTTKVDGCPACGSLKVQHRGTAVTTRGRQNRLQCQGCAYWFSTPIPRKSA